MLQLTLAIVVLIILFAGLRIALGRRRLSIRQFMYIYASVVGGGMLVFLGLTGRLNWLFALLGAALPFLMRVLPWISRSLGLASLYRRLRATTGLGADSQSQSGDECEGLGHDSLPSFGVECLPATPQGGGPANDGTHRGQQPDHPGRE